MADVNHLHDKLTVCQTDFVYLNQIRKKYEAVAYDKNYYFQKSNVPEFQEAKSLKLYLFLYQFCWLCEIYNIDNKLQ